MAPVGQSDHDIVENQIKHVIQDLYHIMIQVNAYDTAGRPTKNVLEDQINTLTTSLKTIHTTNTPSPSPSTTAASSLPSTNPNPSLPPNPLTPRKTTLPSIPPDIIAYVDNGRNPDIYTREFVELARKRNQIMKGKLEAFAEFRDILAGEMVRGMPDVGEDVRRVLENTGGRGGLVDEVRGEGR